MIGKTLYRYIALHSMKGICVTFLVIIGIIMLVDFVESARNLDSDSQISSIRLLYLTLLKSPRLIEQTLPFIVLFGIMGALYGMNRRSELIVMRAAGLSAWKFLRPALCVTAALGVLWSTAVNPLSSNMTGEHDRLVEKWGGPAKTDGAGGRNIWLRDGNQTQQTVILAQSINLPQQEIISATFYILDVEADKTTRFARRYDAKRAVLNSKNNWQLYGVTENIARKTPQVYDTLSLLTNISLDDLRNQTNKFSNPSFWDIRSEIALNTAAGYSTRSLKVQFHKLLALPVTLVAMTLIAAAVSMHLTREGGAIRLLVTGAATGFIVYFIDNVITAFGGSAALPVLLATWAVPLFTLFFGISYLMRIEDG